MRMNILLYSKNEVTMPGKRKRLLEILPLNDDFR